MKEFPLRGRSIFVMESMGLFKEFAEILVCEEHMKLDFCNEHEMPHTLEGLHDVVPKGKYDFVALHLPAVESMRCIDAQVGELAKLEKHKTFVMLQTPISIAALYLEGALRFKNIPYVEKAGYVAVIQTLYTLAGINK